MDVKNCRNCGRLFNYIAGPYMLCPKCMDELDQKFQVVKEYIRNNKNATMNDIAQDNDVTIQQLERWIREERLVFSDDSPIGIACENCGVTIKTGRFCQKCKDTMSNSLSNIYKEPEIKQERNARVDREKARMRFLDN